MKLLSQLLLLCMMFSPVLICAFHDDDHYIKTISDNKEIDETIKEFTKIVFESIALIDEIVTENDFFGVHFTKKNIERLKTMQEIHVVLHKRALKNSSTMKNHLFTHAAFSGDIATFAQRFAQQKKISESSCKKFELLNNRLAALYNQEVHSAPLEYTHYNAKL